MLSVEPTFSDDAVTEASISWGSEWSLARGFPAKPKIKIAARNQQLETNWYTEDKI